MHNDSPDTIAMEESHWAATDVDDVFLPSVRVQLGWREVDEAVTQGAIVPQQAHALWASWASPTSNLRVGATGVAPAFAPTLTDPHWDEPPPPPDEAAAAPQKGGLLLGLLVGLVLGAAGAYLALG